MSIGIKFSCGCVLRNAVESAIDPHEARDAAAASRLMARDKAIVTFRQFGDQEADIHVRLQRTTCPLHPGATLAGME